MDEPLQKSLERYDVLDRIAVGGMAEVFLAKAYGAHGFEKTLAIKRILPELARDPEFEARFIAEAKVAVKLSHANVVQVFDFGRFGDSLFIAMEYVDGLDLAALLRKFKDEKRNVPLPAAFHIAIEIIRALDFAHGHNVVHRDVSPSNILISRAGEVKIGDFGIAVAASPHKASGPGPRKVMGKWRYMSPEQTRGDTLDTRSDLFSAASVLFELFTSEKLFPGDEAEDIIKNIETMPIPRASSIRPGLPSRLDEILAGPLARKPIDRPMRPAQMLRSLIELSYESSIMATALDVAEAVATVLPAKRISGPGQQLDDVIRKQLGAAQEKSVARRTAVTEGKPPSTQTLDRIDHSTGLFRKLGDDGLSRLEEIDPNDPTSVRHEVSGSSESGMHKVLGAHFDPDRHTEVGGPPTGQQPKVTDGGKSITTFTGGGSRRGLIAIGALVVAGGAFGVYKLTRTKDPDVIVPPVADAATEEAKGILAIDPAPSGASGTLTGPDGAVTKFKTTPQRLKVTANVKVHVHIELANYGSFDDDYTVLPNETMVIAPRLSKARATLHVVTTPDRAQVELDHRVLGDTPLTRDDLSPVTDAELVITKPGFDIIHQRITLVVDRTTEITEPLKASAKFGAISLKVVLNAANIGWGDVYFKGAPIGRADKAPKTFGHLPVGKQVLKLVNSGRTPPIEWTVTCDVVENATTPCSTKQGGG